MKYIITLIIVFILVAYIVYTKKIERKFKRDATGMLVKYKGDIYEVKSDMGKSLNLKGRSRCVSKKQCKPF